MKKYLFILSVYLFIACWDRQENDITAPEIPNYTLSATVVDIDLNEPLAAISVIITAGQLSYPVAFNSDTLITNDQGQFFIENLVIGNYELTFHRDGQPVLIYRYFQGYEDKDITFNLPSVYDIENVLENYNNIKFTVFDDPVKEQMNGLALIETQNDSEDNMLQLDLIFAHWTETDSWKIPLKINDIGLVNLCYGSNAMNFFLMYSADSSLFNFILDDGMIYTAHHKKLSFPGLDVYWWDHRLYLASKGLISIYTDESMEWQQELFFTNPEAWLTSICRDSSYFWISDINDQFLYQCDLDLNILKTYAPFFKNQRMTITDMAMDSKSNIWFVIRK